MDETERDQTGQTAAPPDAQQMQFHFIKGSSFRVVHANGTWFGVDGEKNIHLSFYSERTPIPKMIVVNLDTHGHTVSEDASKRVTKEGMIREVEVDVVLSLAAATYFHTVLGQNILALQNAQESEPAK